MTQGEKLLNYKVTSDDVPFSPSLNSLISSDTELNKGNLEASVGTIIHDEQKRDQVPISKRDSSTATQKEIVFPGISQNQSDKPCTHIVLHKNEEITASNSMPGSEVNKCACRSERGSQSYTVNIRNEPTTIVITRRGSTNSITAVGSCARFRAGGNGPEHPYLDDGDEGDEEDDEEGDEEEYERGEKEYEDEKEDENEQREAIRPRAASGNDWQQTVPDKSEQALSPLSSISDGHEVTESTIETQRMSSRPSRFLKLKQLPESAVRRLTSRSSRASSLDPNQPKRRSGFKTRFSQAFVAKDRKFLGPGPDDLYEDEDENINKSEGSTKGDSKSKYFINRFLSRQTGSKPREPAPSRSTSSRSSSRNRADTDSEALYYDGTLASPLPSEQEPQFVGQPYPMKTSRSVPIHDQYAQTETPPHRYCSTLETFLQRHLRACNSCGMPTIHLSEDINDYGEEVWTERMMGWESTPSRPLHFKSTQVSPQASRISEEQFPTESSESGQVLISDVEDSQTGWEKPTSVEFHSKSTQVSPHASSMGWERPPPGVVHSTQVTPKVSWVSRQQYQAEPSESRPVSDVEDSPMSWERQQSGESHSKSTQASPEVLWISEQAQTESPQSGMHMPYSENEYDATPGVKNVSTQSESSLMREEQIWSNTEQQSPIPEHFNENKSTSVYPVALEGEGAKVSHHRPSQKDKTYQCNYAQCNGSEIEPSHHSLPHESVPSDTYHKEHGHRKPSKHSEVERPISSHGRPSSHTPHHGSGSHETHSHRSIPYSESKKNRPLSDSIHCRHCGSVLPSDQDSNIDGYTKTATPNKDVSYVLWALAKVTVYKDGTRSFEILESTSTPPGHYLMPANEEYMLLPVHR